MPLPQRGDCRMGGTARRERDLSPYCYNVYTQHVGLYMFARLYDGTRLGRSAAPAASSSHPAPPTSRYLFMRILRDVSELWKFRSLIKAAATRRFTYFPDIGWLMAFPGTFTSTRCAVSWPSSLCRPACWAASSSSSRSASARATALCSPRTSGGIIDLAQRCSQQVVKTYPQAVWLAMTTMFQVLYGDYIPTSHVARIMCAIATFNGAVT